ncbi:MAG: NHL repeat-containing protein [Planctomycetota bacterium]
MDAVNRGFAAKTRVLGMLIAVAALAGCGGSSVTGTVNGTINSTGPRISTVQFVDVDGNGVDAGDILIVTFEKVVYISSTSATAFEFSSSVDTLGSSPTMTQTVPGSTKVEVILGTDATLVAGTSTLNIGAQGGVNIRDATNTKARPANVNISITDFTTTAPTLITGSYNDTDQDGTLNVGDTVLCVFDKPIIVPVTGSPVSDNFILLVMSDLYGGGASLSAYSSEATNRGALITLGSAPSPVLTVSGAFDSGVTAPGSPSGITMAGAGITIKDTLTSSANTATVSTSVDLGEQGSTRFLILKAASLFPGNVDATAPDVSGHGFYGLGGTYHMNGSVTVGSNTFTVDLFFVADTDNNRVLIYDGKPSGLNADAQVVLGQADLFSNLPNRSIATSPTPSANTLWGPQDVHYQASTNQLFVSDSKNHRVLVYSGVIDGTTGELTLTNGSSASLVIGQPNLGSGEANQGEASPNSRTLNAPQGIHVENSQIAVADRDNNRVLIWTSLPITNNAAANVVLGQDDFSDKLANQGASLPATNTLSGPEDVVIDTDLEVLNNGSGAILIADTDNHRVLVHTTLTPASGEPADVVLGQALFNTAAAATSPTGLSGPTGIAGFAGAGGATNSRIWVADRANHRVMVYLFDADATAGGNELENGETGTAIGQVNNTSGVQNRIASGAPAANSFAFPRRVILDSSDSVLFVADTQNHRVMDFSSPPTTDSIATMVYGQPSFVTSKPKGHTANHPTDATVTAGKLMVADSLNHRVMIYNSVPTSGDPSPDVVVGQVNIYETLSNQGGTAPTSSSLSGPQGVATDGVRLVIADTGNNRVLVYSSIPTSDGAVASVVLGQADFITRTPNTGGLSVATLDSPVGVAISGTKLLVSDRNNHRVLIWNDVTAVTDGKSADVVIGQNDFTSNFPNQGDLVLDRTLHSPLGLTVSGTVLYIADSDNHRVLGYLAIPSSNGQSANFVLGQVDMRSANPGASKSQFDTPTHVATDGIGLVVADGGNHRLLFYKTAPLASGFLADTVLGQGIFSAGSPNRGGTEPTAKTLYEPRGGFFNGADLWVADQKNSRLVRYR